MSPGIAGCRAWPQSRDILTKTLLIWSRLVILGGFSLAFGVLSGLALMEVGMFGIIEPHFQTRNGSQVFADPVITLVLICVWMMRDAREPGVFALP